MLRDRHYTGSPKRCLSRAQKRSLLSEQLSRRQAETIQRQIMDGYNTTVAPPPAQLVVQAMKNVNAVPKSPKPHQERRAAHNADVGTHVKEGVIFLRQRQ